MRVSAARVSRWRALARAGERRRPTHERRPTLAAQRSERALILSLYETTPDITLQELLAALAEHVVRSAMAACGASSAAAASR